MKKIDLHIHTFATPSDAHFEFSMDRLINYVQAANLDAIAVTNHNAFDASQFNTIKTSLSIPVFPGIEIDLEGCHVLLISDGVRLDDFDQKCANVTKEIPTANDDITVAQLKEIFGRLDEYLLIPHTAKSPSIRPSTLQQLVPHVTAGEVPSAKHFIRALKNETDLTPVLFSDSRINDELQNTPTRQTYIDCGEISLTAIKMCLTDKSKVALSEEDGNDLFQVFANGQMLSTGLNILLGERSSGKSYTLDRLDAAHQNVKYIRQFELVQQEDARYERKFKTDIERRRSAFTDDFLRGFKSVVEDVLEVDLHVNDRVVGEFVETLLQSADEIDKRDAFSNTALFDETAFSISTHKPLKDLIASVVQLIDNEDHRDVIEKHVRLDALKSLACELIELLRSRTLADKKRQFANNVIAEVKEGLKVRSSAVQIKDVDLYQIAMDRKKVSRFEEIVAGLRRPAPVSEERIQGFCVRATKGPFTTATEIKAVARTQTGFRDAMNLQDRPYQYLMWLKANENLKPAIFYQLFAKITYEILNKQGYPVSGGERSEFRLLQEIKDAQDFDMLLIDEPESSFDNLFLKSDVVELLKSIADTMPVVVVTHNSTVGATSGAHYILFAQKGNSPDDPDYRLFSGHPTDKELHSADGASIANHVILMNSLEAGVDAYEDRKRAYDSTKN